MAYMAKVIDGVVVAVHSRTPEYNATQEDAELFVQTSYNIRGGVYYDPETGLPAENQAEIIAEQDGRQRKNYAGVGFTYDEERDAFIPPQPFESWVLNGDTCLWEAPVEMPDDGQMYRWDEETTNWVKVEAEESTI
jgi:hypothetical protein